MENQENLDDFEASMLKPSNQNNPIFCTLNFSPIEPLISLGCDWFEVEIFLFFRHWREIHCECKNPVSPSEEDHNILWREPGKLYRAHFVVKPYKTEWLEDYIADGLSSCEKDFPSYVTPGVVRFMQAKILHYLRERIDFSGKLRGLRFDIDVMVDVSTVDLGHNLGDGPLLKRV